MTQTTNSSEELEQFATKIFKRLDDITTKTPFLNGLNGSPGQRIDNFNLKQFTRKKLEEMIVKQKTVLNNKFIVSKLPDGGEKLKKKVSAIEAELAERDQEVGEENDIEMLIPDNRVHGNSASLERLINKKGLENERMAKSLSYKESRKAFQTGYNKQRQDISSLGDLFGSLGINDKIDHPEGYLNTLGEPDYSMNGDRVSDEDDNHQKRPVRCTTSSFVLNRERVKRETKETSVGPGMEELD
jgi:hypothetical protein